jgi:hypothetical protein
VYLPWQIQRDISRSRLDDTMRAARYAYRNAELHRRPIRRIAVALQWVSDWLADAVPHPGGDPGGRAAATDNRDFGLADVRLTVLLVDGPEDPLGMAPVRGRRATAPADGVAEATRAANNRRGTGPPSSTGRPATSTRNGPSTPMSTTASCSLDYRL